MGTKPSSNCKGRVIKRTDISTFVYNPPYIDWGPTAKQSSEVIKMWCTNMYRNIKKYQKYLVTSIKVVCATRSLYASSGPKAEGVPIKNQRWRGSGPCCLWGGLERARHKVPTALLVRLQRFRNDLYKAVKGPRTSSIVLSMIAGSYWVRQMNSRRGSTSENFTFDADTFHHSVQLCIQFKYYPSLLTWN